MTLNILQLPPELIAHVLRFLSSSDLATVALVSKQCRDLVSLESLWQHRCGQGELSLISKLAIALIAGRLHNPHSITELD